MPVLIRREMDGKVIGKVEGNVFRKTIHAEKHIYENWQVLATDVFALDQAEAAGATEMEVTVCFKEGGTVVYRTSIAKMRQEGKELPDHGHGKQIGLYLNLWTLVNPLQDALF